MNKGGELRACEVCGNTSGFKVPFNNVTVCSLCINEASELISSAEASERAAAIDGTGSMDAVKDQVAKLMTPKALCDKLDQLVVGQASAKKALSAAIFQHQKRAVLVRAGLGDKVKKSNLLMVGATGTGKTLLVETIAKLTNLPVYIHDANTLTQAGYLGEDVEQLVIGLVAKCNGDVTRAEYDGIVFIDEIDKIAKSSASASHDRDPSGTGVQDALLTMTQGVEVLIPQTKVQKTNGRGEARTSINTANILFIACGAFTGTEKLTRSSSPSQGAFGFNQVTASSDKTSKESTTVVAEDLIKFGMKSEFVGRFSTIIQLEELTKDQLVEVILNPNNGYFASQQVLASAEGVELTMTLDGAAKIAEYAIQQKIGARGLEGAINKVLSDFQFEAGSRQCTSLVVTEEYVASKLFD